MISSAEQIRPLVVENLAISFQGQPIIKQSSFAIVARSVTSIIGASGAGKTTLLRSLNRLLEEEQGFEIRGDRWFSDRHFETSGLSCHALRRRVGIVFQKPTIFPTSVFNNVIFGLRHVMPKKRGAFHGVVEDCLKAAGLWEEVKDRLHSKALKLSLGQQQRLAIARALALEPEVLLMDEPTSALDPQATKRIEDLILRLKSKCAIVVVTHDMEQAARISDQIIALKPSQGGATSEVFANELNIKGRLGDFFLENLPYA